MRPGDQIYHILHTCSAAPCHTGSAERESLLAVCTPLSSRPYCRKLGLVLCRSCPLLATAVHIRVHMYTNSASHSKHCQTLLGCDAVVDTTGNSSDAYAC
jgi:hypothetical protein